MNPELFEKGDISPPRHGGDSTVMADSVSQDTDTQLRYGYQIGTLRFMLPESVIAELLIEPSIYPIPLSPDWLSGVINVRGNIVPVCNLHTVMSGQVSGDNQKYVLLVDKLADSVAVLVDALPRPVKIYGEVTNRVTDQAHIDSVLNNYITEVLQGDGEQWFVFDLKQCCRDMKAEQVKQG